MELKTIDATFAGKNVFVSGGSGFVGRVFVEKLLRSCPNVGKIYLIMREKRGKSLEDRMKEMHDLPLFEKVNEMYPKVFYDKVFAINGDIMELRLGLSDEDYEFLTNNINIIYHSAAVVQFNHPLQSAVLLNTRGSREMCYLALQCKNIECYMHISTCYTNTHQYNIEEKLYPAPGDWRQLIDVAERGDKHQLQVIMGLILQQHRNTYTFAKAMAEHVTHDLLDGKIPNIILRLSVVVPTIQEPIVGWLDNVSGPITTFIMTGMGLQRVAYMGDVQMDYIPVDHCAKAMIVATWNKMNEQKCDLTTEVYNASAGQYLKCTQYELIDYAFKEGVSKQAVVNPVWWPGLQTTTSYIFYYIYFMLFQLLPSLIGELLLKTFTGKGRLLKIQRLLYTAQYYLAFFWMNHWNFINTKLYALNNHLLASDYTEFNFSLDEYDWQAYTLTNLIGFGKYMLNEKVSPTYLKRKMTLLWLLHWAFKLGVIYFVTRLIYVKLFV